MGLHKICNTTKKSDSCILIIITGIIFIQLIKLGDYPGLYFDAINPDYIGVQLLYPQVLETKWQAAWPWLSQIYHGNNGIIITMISTLVTGRTSVLQYHMTYGIVAAVAVFLTFCVLTHKRIGVPKIWAGIGNIILITWPSLLTIIITQFYMCLFGSVCALGGSLLFLDWMDNVQDTKKISLCYVLFGLAFYSYFNFIFFLPSLVLCTAYVLKQKKYLFYDTIVTPMIAYLLGCGLYVVGWSQIALWPSRIIMTASRITMLFLAIYVFFFFAYIAFYHRWKIRNFLLVGYIIGGIIWAAKVLPSIRAIATALGIVENTTLGQKIIAVFNNYSYILNGKYSEGMIFGKQVTVFNTHVLLVVIAVITITLVLELFSTKQTTAWKIPVGIIVLYLCCCIALGTRMSPQHYVPLVFLTFIGMYLCLKSIFISLEDFRLGNKVTGYLSMKKNMLLGILAVCLVFLNLFNEARIINEIRVTGGENYWASELTELADEAVDNKDNGEKELYVFIDWGFFAGFNYLTMNDIPYVTGVDEVQLAQAYTNGSNIVICYWNEEDTTTYEQLFDSIKNENGIISKEEWIDDNGKTEFYEMTLSHESRASENE